MCNQSQRRHSGYPPTLYAVLEASSSDTKAKAKAFTQVLYGEYLFKIESESFKEVLVASLLMYLDDTISSCPNHKMHQTLMDIGMYFTYIIT